MIFITVGGQLPFDRLIVEVEKWYEKLSLEEDVIVQGGRTLLKKSKFCIKDRLSVADFEYYIRESSFVISHAGMGSIITCLKYNKRGVFFPRLKKKGEHRNDHQLSTVEKFDGKFENLYFAYSCEDLFSKLSIVFAQTPPEGDVAAPIKDIPSHDLCDFIAGKISSWTI